MDRRLCLILDRLLLLEGVIDDRGKFIFITPEELSAVAQFIRQRGRVSITELAQASNSLINLTPETSRCVIDDRGKFIFITPEELSAVAQFIRQRGRVSITELAQASNSLINLTPETSAAPQFWTLHPGLVNRATRDRLGSVLSRAAAAVSVLFKTGVIDDRGKFIFITPEELSAVAQFIRQRGRVSITELAQASNSLINLTPETSAAPQVTV
ncbi:DDRGK domain-containing protein 1 [Acipenser ruthenus]|uniref:DDRGK domain-containing protein 1 n=1 Tax=Acipenser ruthenus TaxID=7906 RepID=A0A444UUA4_ACIRT|nr:DDRGK domain-containing protein 1 [Acipenser ruthenus]